MPLTDGSASTLVGDLPRCSVLGPDAVGPRAAQDLAEGTAGHALWCVERAHTGDMHWKDAHTSITSAASRPLHAAGDAGLFAGAPAVAFVLHAASADGTGRYASALETLDRHIHRLIHRRVDHALSRIRAGELATFHEYDVFRGLTGLGALMLCRAPGSTATERLLRYLVALTRPLPGTPGLPAWWVGHDEHLQTLPGGHGNLGLAHGAAGPLALLALAARDGITVDDHIEAIADLTAWYTFWCRHADTGPWWPEGITPDTLSTGHVPPAGPARPSWCYGTPGIARAGQLAALTLGDRHLQHEFETALDQCLSDPAQRERLTDGGLCHGIAGVFQTTWRAARDATSPGLGRHLPGLARALNAAAPPSRAGFLNGAAGFGLALSTADHDRPPLSGWDTCLLIA